MYIGAFVSDRLHGAVVVVTDLEMPEWPAVTGGVHVLTAGTLSQAIGQMGIILAGYQGEEEGSGDVSSAIATLYRAFRDVGPF